MVSNPFDRGISITIGAAVGDAIRGITDVTSSLGSLERRAGVASAAMAAMAGEGIRRSVTAFADFDAAMTESLAIMGEVSETMEEEMTQAARSIARETQFSAEEAAESYFFLASAGLDAAESVEALDDMASFAQAGQFDMAQATDILTDSASALGKEVDEYNDLADVMVRTNQLANTSVEQLGQALTRQAAASMRAANMEIEEGAGVLAAFADQGIKGQRAGTLFRRTIDELQDSARANEEAFEDLGIQVFDADGEMRSMADIVEEMEGAFGDMSTEQRAAAMEQLGFNIRTREGFNALIGNSEALRDYQGELMDAGGAAEEVAENQMDTLNRQWDLLTDRLNAVAITIGEQLAPAFSGFLGQINEQIDAFAGWLEQGSNAERVAETLSAVFTGSLAIAATVFRGALLTVMGTLSGFVAMVVAVGGTIAGVAEAWRRDFAGIRTAVNDVASTLRDTFLPASDEARAGVLSNVQQIRDRFVSATSAIENRLDPIISAIRDRLVRAIETAGERIEPFVEQLRDALGPAIEFVDDVISAAADRILDQLVGAFDALLDITDPVIDFAENVADSARDLGQDMGILGDDVDSTAEMVGDLIGLAVVPWFVNILEAIPDMTDAFRDQFAPAIDAASDVVGSLTDALGDIDATLVQDGLDSLTESFETGSESWTGIIDQTTEDLTTAWQEHGEDVEESWAGMTDSLEELFDRITDEIVPGFTGVFSEDIEDFLANLEQIWEENFSELAEQFVLFTETVMDGIKVFVDLALILWDTFGDELLVIVDLFTDLIFATFETAFDLILTSLTVFLAVLNGDFETALEEITGFVDDFTDRWFGLFDDWGERLLDWLGGLVDDVIDAFVGLATDLIGNSVIPEMLDDIVHAVTNWDIVGQFKDKLSGVRDAFGDLKDTIVGNSIVPEMVDESLEEFQRLGEGGVGLSADLAAGVEAELAAMPAAGPAAGAGGGPNITDISIHVDATSDADGRRIGRDIYHELKSHGFKG